MKRLPLVLIFLSFLSFAADRAEGCAPTAPSTVFSYRYHPDLPLSNFLKGELGVISHDYAKSYLFVAYRHLIGKEFNRREQHEILQRWNSFFGITSESEGDNIKRSELVDFDWIGGRKKVPGASAIDYINSGRSIQKDGVDLWYENCLPDAFATAIKTLNQRIVWFGLESLEVKEWLKGQDIVFSNCSEGKNSSSARNIPPSLEGTINPVIKADRAYQIAAAYFYSGEFDTAWKLFREIADDGSSPWNKVARYLAARSLVRKASLNAGPGKNDTQVLIQAKTELEQILAAPNLKEIHDISNDLLGLVETRIAPDQKLKSLAGKLLAKDNDDLNADLSSYIYLLDRFSSKPVDDMTDWIMHFAENDSEYSITRWKETSSLPWLVSALSHIKPEHPDSNSILARAEKVDPSSPAYTMVAYHTVRIFIESGKKDAARNKLDEILLELKGAVPLSSLNLFLSQRMALAQDLDEFLTFAQRIPVGVFYDENGREVPYKGEEFEKEVTGFRETPLFDKDSVSRINELFPVRLMKDVSKNNILSAHLQREMAVAAWSRAVLLDDYKAAQELSPIMIKYFPEGEDNFKIYEGAKSISGRRFAAALILLKYPGMRPYVLEGAGRLTPVDKIDSYRENWWCALGLPIDLSASNSTKSALASRLLTENVDKAEDPLKQKGLGRQRKAAQPLSFLSSKQVESARNEHNLLTKISAAPVYLTEVVVEWAKRHPRDIRVPEALHLAVRSTRYGCADTKTSEYSKRAFQLLHKKYPNSEWTKRTPYWF